MTPEEFEKEMERICSRGDIELDHSEADDLLCKVLSSLGYQKGVQIFVQMAKWYA